jgi:tetratricopeptide (TPR) repeat protein
MSAKSYLSEALDPRRKIATSNTTSALGFLAMGCLNYAKMLTELGDHEVADAYYREAIALYADLCVRDSKFKIDHTIAQYYLATALEATDADEALRLITPVKMSLEEAIEFIAPDELIEVTPKNIRLRKRILDTSLRLKDQFKKK